MIDGKQPPGSVSVQLLGNSMKKKVRPNELGRATIEVAAGDYVVKVMGRDIIPITIPSWHIGDEGECFQHLWISRTHSEGASGVADTLIDVSELSIPKSVLSRFSEALSSFANGDLNKSKELFLQAGQLYPSFSRVYSNLGTIAIEQGDRIGAYQYFRKALSLNPHNFSARRNLAVLLYFDHEYPEARQLLTACLSEGQRSPAVYSLLAKVQLAEGKRDEALSLVREALSGPHAGYEELYLIAAVAREQQGKLSDAIQEYHNFISLSANRTQRRRAEERIAELSKMSQPTIDHQGSLSAGQ